MKKLFKEKKVKSSDFSLRFLDKNRKGLSGIITAILIVGIAIVMVGVVWYTINNVLEAQTKEVGSSSDCLSIRLNINSAGACPAGSTSCNVVVERSAGGGDIAGVKVIVSDGTSTLSGTSNSSLGVLEMTTITATGSALSNSAKTAKVAAIISDSSGGTYTCEVIGERDY